MESKEKRHIELGHRIRKAIAISGKNQAEFAVLMSVPASNLTRWIKGEVAPSYETLITIGKLSRVSMNWLLTGEEYLTAEMIGQARKNWSVCDSQALYDLGGVKVDVFVLAGAGSPKELIEPEPIATIMIPDELHSISIVPVKVRGRSMEPIIRDGAYIGVDRADRQVISGEIYAIWIPYEGAIVKRLFMEMERVIVKSDNAEFPSFSILFSEIHNDNFILGRVKWVIQKL